MWPRADWVRTSQSSADPQPRTGFAKIPADSSPFRGSAGFPLESSNGLCSLLLLGGTEPHGRVLYLLDWPAASVAVSHARGVRSASIVFDGWTHLPLLPHSVDAIVADFDAVPDDDAVRCAVAVELRRVLKTGGQCIAAVTRRRRPRDARAWRRYRFVAPLLKWHDAVRRIGIDWREAAWLRFDGERLAEIQLVPRLSATIPAGRAHAAAVVLFTNPEERSAVEAVSDTLRHELGVEGIHRIHVRKIGKTAAFVAAGRARMVVRMPCSPAASARARRNYAALEALHHATGVSRELVPKPLGRGKVGNQPYFVETCVPGKPREPEVARISWEPQAVELITALHVTTARRRLLTDVWFRDMIEPALSDIERLPLDNENRMAMLWLRSTLRDRLIGRELPLVRSHGDFTGGNCLYNARGRLTGVVDWELSRADALPLLDLLQCVDLPAEYTRDCRWARADLVFDAVEGRGPLSGAPEITRYVHTLGVPDDVVPALLLMHWVDHAGARVLVRQSDRRWLQHRVSAPLRRLRELAQRSHFTR